MGKDDEKYMALMSLYKQHRVDMGQRAMKFMDEAIALRTSGDVSDDVVKGMAIL